MPRIMKPSDVAARISAGETVSDIFGEGGAWKAKLLGPQADILLNADEDTRSVDFIISTESVDRYTDSVKLGGWKTDAYKKNPIVLWQHDDSVPPIGKASDTRVANSALRSTVTFASKEIHPLADTIYQLIRGGFLSAASVGFVPLKYKAANEAGRAFGLDILEQELLEFSVVNIPANSDCLVQGRALGIDTGPLAEWAEKILDGGSKVIVPREELEALRKAAKMPKKPAKKVKITSATMVRGLFSVGELAQILAQLDWLEDSVEWEEEFEGDGSDISARLADAMKTLGQILLDMTAEEVSELFADENSGAETSPDMIGPMMDSAKPAQRFMLKLGMMARRTEKAGKAISSENMMRLTKAMEHIQGVMDSNTADPDANGDNETTGGDIGTDGQFPAKALREQALATLAATRADQKRDELAA